MTSAEERADASFTTLPYEIHDLIFPYLDPIALISLSQTSTTFRKLICPQPHNFTERLLALELDPRYGGPIPIYTDSPDIMFPSFEDVEAWAKIKYACTACGKLRSHLAFDNHSILRLRNREPMISQPTAHLEAWYRQPMCNWEGRLFCNWYGRVGVKTRGKHFQARIKADQEAAAMCKKIRRQPEEEQPKENLEAAEAWLCGSQRRRRTCNECRFQRGDFERHTNSNRGNAITPIIKSRPRKFHDSVERYFPGLVPSPLVSKLGTSLSEEVTDGEQNGLVAFYTSQATRYPILQRIYRQREFTYQYWTLYQVRCPSCKLWLEFRHFGRGGAGAKATPMDSPTWDVMDWKPEVSSWRCNECVIRADGKEVLAQDLLAHWRLIAGEEMRVCEYVNKNGWSYVTRFLKENKIGVTWSTLVDGAVGNLSEVEKSTAWGFLNAYRHSSHLDFDGEHIRDHVDDETHAVLCACWKHYVETTLKPSGIWDRPTNESGLKHSNWNGVPEMNPWFQKWTEDYFVKVARWTALNERDMAFKATPSLLVDYALQAQRSQHEQRNEMYSDVGDLVVKCSMPPQYRR